MRNLSATILIILLASGLLASCVPPAAPTAAPVQADPEYWPTQEWRASSPEGQGMDSDRLAQMFEHIQAQKLDLHSLLVVRNGYLVAEAYFDPYNSHVRHYAASLTKSVVGALVGIAIDQGKIQSVDQKVLDFFPGRRVANLDARKQAMTLEHLLALSSGLDLPDFTPQPQMEQSSGWVQFALDLPMAAQPGARFAYGNEPVHLLSAILQKTTGEETRLFANRFLFDPLGIPPAMPGDWSVDPQGYTTGGIGLYLAPRDLAKFAYLYLNEGKWDGQQVVPAGWVKELLTGHTAVGKDKTYANQERQYGYLWSVFPEQHYFAAFGMGGQHLYLLPEQNMVVVFTAGLKPDQDSLLIELVNDYILPAAASKTALPANPAAAGRLEATIQAAAHPIRPVPALNQTALDISGHIYSMDPNPNGWKEFGLTFTPGAETARVQADGNGAWIGLNNLYQTTNMPGGAPLVLRGAWEAAGTFVVDAVNLGEIYRSQFHLKFADTSLDITVIEPASGSTLFTMHGRLKE